MKRVWWRSCAMRLGMTTLLEGFLRDVVVEAEPGQSRDPWVSMPCRATLACLCRS